MPIHQHGGHGIVPVGEGISFDYDGFTGRTFNGKTAAVDARREVLYDDADFTHCVPPASLGCQHQHPQRWKAQVQRIEMSVRWQWRRLDGAEVTYAAAPVIFGIAVQPLTPGAAAGYADLVVV